MPFLRLLRLVREQLCLYVVSPAVNQRRSGGLFCAGQCTSCPHLSRSSVDNDLAGNSTPSTISWPLRWSSLSVFLQLLSVWCLELKKPPQSGLSDYLLWEAKLGRCLCLQISRVQHHGIAQSVLSTVDTGHNACGAAPARLRAQLQCSVLAAQLSRPTKLASTHELVLLHSIQMISLSSA